MRFPFPALTSVGKRDSFLHFTGCKYLEKKKKIKLALLTFKIFRTRIICLQKNKNKKMLRLKIFGVKQSICCSALSAWGIIMLGTLGFLFRVRSVALFEDLPEFHFQEDKPINISAFHKFLDAEFEAVKHFIFLPVFFFFFPPVKKVKKIYLFSEFV